MINNFVCTGRFTRDPELKTYGQVNVCRFNLGIDRTFKKEGQPDVDFPTFVAFGKTAEFICKYFKKGMKIEVARARVQTGKYDDKDGKTVYTTEFVVDEVGFAESKKASENKSVGGAPEFTQPSGDPAYGQSIADQGFAEPIPF